MAITADKILEMKPEEFAKQRNTPCSSCGVPLRESTTGCRNTKKGPMCSDCYYKLLSKHYDKNPITTPNNAK